MPPTIMVHCSQMWRPHLLLFSCSAVWARVRVTCPTGKPSLGAHGDARAAANLASGVQSPPSALGSAPIGARYVPAQSRWPLHFSARGQVWLFHFLSRRGSSGFSPTAGTCHSSSTRISQTDPLIQRTVYEQFNSMSLNQGTCFAFGR